MNYIKLILLLMTIFISSCEKKDHTFGPLTAPDLPQLDIQVAGKSTVNPNGDGSGKVSVHVMSANAINYRIDFGDGSEPLTNTVNSQTHLYTHVGTQDFIITVTASGRGGISSTSSQKITIRRDFVANPELVEMLTNNSSKIWVVDSLAPAHFGVGPSTSLSPDWWSAPPLDKSGLGVYDDEYVFKKEGNSFTHITNNSLYGKQEYLKDFDAGLTGTGDYTLTGTKAAAYTETFSYDGSADTEYIIFSAKGHLGIYLGTHRYQILSRSGTQMSLRTIGKDGNAWYVKIKAK
ncbi:PKD domain-containing protein [Haoranjiania flava]|uniref:PKD domain-containing protein n=1 Tax=Haoranjiania flava TaxID=1856322 RepID=A0AAE3IL49_9BACT|nr:PKD domain-containing protein [Haoranjiania flava]MCU7694165.1 PKD domain-containing protein [Haoranjiania flava]